jgi:hypothetical protein
MCIDQEVEKSISRAIYVAPFYSCALSIPLSTRYYVTPTSRISSSSTYRERSFIVLAAVTSTADMILS